MSATFIPWENGLAKVMREAGGVRAGEAIVQAAQNLQSIQAECLSALDGQLGDLERLCAEGGTAPADELKLEIYRLANDIVAVAGVFSLADLGNAAFSLCELVDRLRTNGRWNQAAVSVHLSAFRLLRQPDDQNDRSAIVEGLKRLTERIPTAEG